MTREERATRHYRTHSYPFRLVNEDDASAGMLVLTTEQAKDLAEALAELGSTISVEAPDPEFLGWTVKEIAENLEDSEDIEL